MSPERQIYSWIELAAMPAPGRMTRGHFVNVEDREAISTWREQHRNTDVYASIFRFTAPRRDSQSLCPFFMDVDAHDNLEQAREQTLRACDRLTERLGIDPTSFDLSFSGAKGCHLIVLLEVFGNPTEPVPIGIWGSLAGRLSKEGLNRIDRGVYQTSRILRLPNSINSKTGLYKIPLEYKELRDLTLADILELARAPREFESMAVPEESPRAVGWLAQAIEWRKTTEVARRAQNAGRQGQGWRTPRCVRNVERAFLPDGFRHQVYYALARFYATTGMAPEEAIDRLQEIDRRHPIRDPDYLKRVVRSAWNTPGFSCCPSSPLGAYCDGRSFCSSRARIAVPNVGQGSHEAPIQPAPVPDKVGRQLNNATPSPPDPQGVENHGSTTP